MDEKNLNPILASWKSS